MKKNERMRPAVEEGELDFSGKYSLERAREYYRKHQKGSLGRRISNRWEQQMAGRALKLAGNPRSVLDLPCGTGRFWELLARDPDRELLAADYSEAMLVVAQEERPQEIVQRFRVFQSSAFDIQLPDNAVENIFCMRLLHHIGESEDRLRILKEFHRVARDSVCISMWVDGNYKAWKRQRAVKRRPKRKRFDNRFLHSRQQVESEQACLRPRDRFWDIPVPKIDSAFDNPLVPQPSWSPSTTQQL
ncbi:class I SAM-dependent methyltransferase, partial [Thiolapillus sp.]